MCVFKVGDKIRRIVNNLPESDIYEIERIDKTVEGDWHDGYYEVWYAYLKDNPKIHMIYFHHYGDKPCEYAVLE